MMSVLALCFAVVYFGYQANIAQWNSNTDYCNTVTVPGSLASAARDYDLSFFAETAAAARRKDGDIAIAEKYDEVAKSARARAKLASERAGVPCSDRFPKPSLFGSNNAQASADIPEDIKGGEK